MIQNSPIFENINKFTNRSLCENVPDCEKKITPDAINYYFSHTTFQNIFPKTDIHRRASLDSDDAFLSENTRVALQEVYERLYCSKKELNPFLSHAKRMTSVNQKVKYRRTQECHARQVRQRVEEMDRRRSSVGYESHPMKGLDDEKERAVSAPLTRTSSPVGRRADDIRRKWRNEISTPAGEIRLRSFQKRLQRPCAAWESPSVTFPGEVREDDEQKLSRGKEELRSGGDCIVQYQPRKGEMCAENKKKFVTCDKEPRLLHPDFLYGNSSRLDPVTAASVHPDCHKLVPSSKAELEEKTTIHSRQAEQQKYFGVCPSLVDGLTFETTVAAPQMALPMSPIDIYCSLEENRTLYPPPLFHPAAYRSQLHQKYLDLYKDSLPKKNLEDDPAFIKILFCNHLKFDPYLRHLNPFEQAKRRFTVPETVYPIIQRKYKLSSASK